LVCNFRTILESPVTEPQYVEQLRVLSHKAQFVNSAKDTRAARDVQDIVQKLTIKATSKVREHLLSSIYKLRKPMTNYQIPQNGLLKNK